MTPIVRACSNPQFKRVVVVMGAQMSKTESLFNVIGHRMMDDPAHMLYIGPTQKLVESYSEGRVMPMLRSTPALWERLAKGKKNKITEKFIGGVRLGFGWAGSATELAGHPAALVLVDERDRMVAVKGEGDPVELAEARASTYADGRVIVASTPTVGTVVSRKLPTGLEHWELVDTEDEKNAGMLPSPIWKLWQEGTRYEWAWPCPDCGEFFIPRFNLLKWPEGCTAHRALKEARLVCPHCGSLIDNVAKQKMNERGLFVAPGQTIDRDGKVSGEVPQNHVASFWVSGLCSPWKSFGERAAAYIGALKSGDRERIQSAINTGFGELHSLSGDAPDWQVVADLREGYESGVVPAPVRVLTCCVDVQKDRLVYAVRGWGYNMESWLIEHGELWGETAYDAVWLDLAKLLDREFGDRKMKPRLMLIDSGYKPGEPRNPDNQIYLFCRRHRGRAFPSKGHDKQDAPYKASKIDVSFKGKVIKNGLDLWHLDSDYFKTWVHARLEWPKGESGSWHLPSDATDDYCKQLVAEQRVVAPNGRVQWVRTQRDNHFLDVEALNVAAAHILRVQDLKPAAQPAAPANDGEIKQEAAPERAPAQRPAPRPIRPAPRQSFTNRWRM